MQEKIKQAAHFINSKIKIKPETAIILGTGLSSLSEDVAEPVYIPYKDIPNFPVSTAPSHKGRLVIGKLNNVPVLMMQGRVHIYEGYSMQEVTFPIRVMKELGITNLIVTNAAGSLKEQLPQGSIVLLSDHINFMGSNPLIGKDDPYLGDRFPSMNEPYSYYLSKIALDIALDNNIDIKQGVYLAVTGPNLETKSECRAFATIGADLVGMSTIPEVIVAVQSKIAVLGFSIVTNMSNLFHNESHSQEEIQETANKALKDLRFVIFKLLERIAS